MDVSTWNKIELTDDPFLMHSVYMSLLSCFKATEKALMIFFSYKL